MRHLCIGAIQLVFSGITNLAKLLLITVCTVQVVFPQQNVFFPLTKQTLQTGLSSPHVRKIVQDKYGFMWLATQDGLNRFDGTQYVIFNSGSVDQNHIITGTDVYDIAIDASGEYLWVLTAYNGLSKIELRTCRVVSTHPIQLSLPAPKGLWLKCMFIKGSHIFIGTNEGYYIRFNTANAQIDQITLCTASFHASGSIDRIYASNNNIWLFISGTGIVLLDPAGNKHISTTPLPSLTFYDVSAGNGLLFAASSNGILSFSLNTGAIDSTSSWGRYLYQLTKGHNWQALHYANDTLLATGIKGCWSIDLTRRQYTRIICSRNYEDKDWILLTSSIVKTGRSIWLGTQYGAGCIRDLHTPFVGFNTSMDGSGLNIRHSNMLATNNDSTIIVCADDGTYLVNHTTGKFQRIFSDDVFYSVFKAPGNYIIASGVTSGLHIADENGRPVSLKKVFPELLPIQKDVLISATRFNDSLYFLASQNEKGLYKWNIRLKQVTVIDTGTRPIQLTGTIINRLYTDAGNKLWVLGDNYISIIDPLAATIRTIKPQVPQSKKELSIIMDMCELAGSYWLTVYGIGIVQLNANLTIRRIFSIREGLNNTGVYKLFPLGNLSLLVSTNNGLSVLDTRTGLYKNYFEQDGLQSSSFEETSGASQNGFMFMGGTNGFTRIDINKFNINTGPPVTYFTNIRIHKTVKAISSATDTMNAELEELVIPSSWVQANISFAGIHFANPDKVTYAYRIRQQDTNWIANGPQHFITLMGLRPGAYTLEIKSANEDGYWSAVKKLNLIIKPKWFQTIGFKLLVCLLAAGLIYALYRYRLYQLYKQHLIRKNIASDLHDDIGSTLNTVKIFTHLAKKDVNDFNNLNQIEMALTEASTGLRDMIWILDDSGDTVYDLLERVKKFAVPVTVANGVHLQCTNDDKCRHLVLSKNEKRNLLLIAKETINNSLKYAQCKNITINIELKKGALCMTIDDDGEGFIITSHTDGNGLGNINFRAGQIGYTAIIQSTPGKGTQVKVARTS
ncbi:triple tyrosine motif-containing protein [Niastella sp. OAS944]|uniref:sensor histidine kinase n=1 Tax=Niastella sp. OAS944 TaxID=2664089 RepID=UPI00347DDEDD|nr:ligand-binding sensor domain-containing protein [Chitinophagaceae bacterium OAS944]